jgi:hypothetical protein
MAPARHAAAALPWAADEESGGGRGNNALKRGPGQAAAEAEAAQGRDAAVVRFTLAGSAPLKTGALPFIGWP